ncbi:hypothetical protein [Paraburkholderia acidisoli]|uniref:Uncharacterized protein n=1 Tax=Paraburkholderia acidisoli TaxID=2571748 RepID=A0A7Z2GPG2_9BURK|nr:hypothetical protein [Paraburkholderia acidisoli]QGZ65547.1 hypothetical protein FAZ98_27775 [Paraburkholderia acidisoli]
MTPERFHTLVDAWGADPRRWPEQERADALAWARAHRDEADAALAAALELDAWLARDFIEPPSRTLVERIVTSAPSLTPPLPRRKDASRRRFWWSGVGLAGVGLAGALAGAFAMSFALLAGAPGATHTASDPAYSGYDTAHQSSFLGSLDDGSDE